MTVIETIEKMRAILPTNYFVPKWFEHAVNRMIDNWGTRYCSRENISQNVWFQDCKDSSDKLMIQGTRIYKLYDIGTLDGPTKGYRECSPDDYDILIVALQDRFEHTRNAGEKRHISHTITNYRKRRWEIKEGQDGA